MGYLYPVPERPGKEIVNVVGCTYRGLQKVHLQGLQEGQHVGVGICTMPVPG